MNIQDKFLNFFINKNHKLYDSAPLVGDDPTLLFVNAGMVQFKDIFTGKQTPKHSSATSAQLCLRAGGKHNDLENVGYTRRHHTLFTMLGNFSFGDYFKEKAIEYAFEFVINELQIDKRAIYISVHKSDDEAYELWSKYINTQKIKRFGDKDNFWQMGDTGPCGPCSEIFVDQGNEYFNRAQDYFGGEGDRFLEIWNLVFMQYERFKNGELKKLVRPCVDTGMGLERVVAIKEKKISNFDTSIFMPLINKAEILTHVKYIYDKGFSHRIIADHIRSVVLLVAQGVNFDKEGRGYVLRRILRRAIRHGYMLGMKKPFMYKIADDVIEGFSAYHSYLIDKRNFIKEAILNEEERFFGTIFNGMELFKKELNNIGSAKVFSGKVAFKLYDTYGFPLDLTADMLKESGLRVDMQSFEKLMSEQKQRGKASSTFSADSNDVMDLSPKFVGYDALKAKSAILGLFDEKLLKINKISKNNIGYIVLENTPFYAQGGGQCGDTGTLCASKEIIAEILDTTKINNINISKIKVLNDIALDFICEAKVDEKRLEIAKHHSATHILHSVLRSTLGSNVAQAGSLVEHNRLRFDFTHNKPLNKEQVDDIEFKVNQIINKTISQTSQITTLQSAKDMGAMALFGDKYDEGNVRVVRFGDFSIELCGGTHVQNSAEIGTFVIIKEGSVSSGVRRIEALCGISSYKYIKNIMQEIDLAKNLLKTSDIVKGIKKLKDKSKNSLSASVKQNTSFAINKKDIKKIKNTNIIIASVENGDIKSIIDEQKDAFENLCIMLFQINNDKILVAAGVKNAKIKANEWIKSICNIIGGGGGGRGDFATAGGKNTDSLDKAKEVAMGYVRERI